MSKGLEALENIDKDYALASKANGDFIPKWYQNELIEPIKKELKDKEQQDSVLKTLKEVIAFAEKLPDIEIDDDGNIQSILGAIGMRIQRQMENKERELLRKFVLETCFPKELKALEIIKEKRVNVDNFLNRIKRHTNYKEYKTLCERYRILVISDKELTKEEYNLLKEVLL